MAKKKKTITKTISKPRLQKTKSFFESRQNQTIIGLFIALFAIFLFIAFISYLFNWQQDQSQLSSFSDKNTTVKNLLGKIGASISHFFIYKNFGIAAIYLPILLFFSGVFVFLNAGLKKVRKSWGWGILGMLWFSISFGFLAHKNSLLPGVIGFELNNYFQQFLGKTGLILVLLFLFISFLVIRFKLTPEAIKVLFPSKNKKDFEAEEKINPVNIDSPAIVSTSE
jgi:S-DNA-T family DNA segregation ATPase FtsK/SpoIIIE